MPAGQFQASPGPHGSTSPAPAPAHGIAAGWLPDPSGRHEQRFWSGTAWTDHVTDGGVPGTDPFPDLSRRRDEPAPGDDGSDQHRDDQPPNDAPPTG
jgi:hypothetical protein